MLPAVGRMAAARGRWKRFDVTTLVHGDGAVEIALVGGSRRAVLLTSREAGRRQAPRLHLRVSADRQPGFPIRAASYVATYPQSWQGPGVDPLTRYHPRLGAYDGAADSVIRDHVAALRWGGVEAGVASWDGPGTSTDTRGRGLLASTGRTGSSFPVGGRGRGRGRRLAVAERDLGAAWVSGRGSGSPPLLPPCAWTPGGVRRLRPQRRLRSGAALAEGQLPAGIPAAPAVARLPGVQRGRTTGSRSPPASPRSSRVGAPSRSARAPSGPAPRLRR